MEGTQTELDYENQAFIELLSEDGIVIFARGLGLNKLFLKFLKLYSDPHSLVLVINMSSGQEQYFINCLKKDGVCHLPKSITNEVTSKERDTLYLNGGVLFVTSRILVVDLLKKVCPVEKVSGILVYNAHKLTDTSSESFIVRLYRERNQSGFIKAFSDSPESFMKGFCQLEKIMRNLFIRNAYLWPRFHAVVNASLQRHKPDVVELRQQLTPNMTAIQLAILDIMKACLSELKKANTMLDADNVTVENCLGKTFDQIIKLHFDPIWHELSYQSRHLVNDLKMFRTLLFFLTQYDCVTFYSYLEYLRSSGTTRAFTDKSPWVFMEAANTLFVKSKERVFLIPEEKNEANSTAVHCFEESPKWHLLSMVLEEIDKEYRERNKDTGCGQKDNNGSSQSGIEESGSGQKDNNGSSQSGIEESGSGQKDNNGSGLEGSGSGQKDNNGSGLEGSGSGQKDNNESGLEGSGSGQKEDNGSCQSDIDGSGSGPTSDSGRRQVQEKVLIVTNDYRTSYQLTEYLQKGGQVLLENLFNKLLLRKVNINDLPRDMQKSVQTKYKTSKPPKKKSKITKENVLNFTDDIKGVMEEIELNDFETVFGELIETQDTPLQILTTETSNFSVLPGPVTLIYSLSCSSNPYTMTTLLNDIRPRVIIMYDNDVRLIRQIEVFKACNPGKQLRVYSLVYDSSVEEQKFLTSLRKEKEAFQNLIHQKAHMVIPADREGRHHDDPSLKRRQMGESSIKSSRKGGGKNEEKGPQTVIVDMREFRSSLPSLLHKRGIDIIPVTLEVGDYILSPDLCVERKSLSDLVGSLNSGRLYNQATAMTRYYKRPVLLIEFEEGRSFSLQSLSTIINNGVSSQNIASKLVLLTIHFPKLRIFWCSSPHITAELFESIKVSHPQPNAETAAAIGVEGGPVTNERHYNPTVQDCLLKLPGINTRNYRYIMEKVKDFQELVKLSEAELSAILENDVNGKLLWNGLHGKPDQPVIVTGKKKGGKRGSTRGRNKSKK